ncbi:TolC family protein [Weeksellaceae bacterium TAE3-ERU29]|nr:TolC family protein [Weeksellaceae bacterium TAE3-ERU29]
MKKIIILIGVLLFQWVGAQQSFSLQEAIDYTLEHNYDIQRSELEIKKAEKKIWETTATGLPHIDGGVDYNYNIDIPVAVFQGQIIPLGSKQNLTANIQATQLIFSGSYIVGLQSAKAFKKISLLSKEKVRSTLMEAVINAYAGVLIGKENIKILENNLKTTDKNLYEITEIYKAGMTEQQNVDQLKYTVTKLKSSINFAKSQEKKAENTLKYIMGIPQSQEIVLTGTLDDLMQDYLILLSKENAQKIEEHIDYQIADHQVHINELQVKYEKSKALPSLSTFLSHSQNNFSKEEALFKGFDQWNPTTVWGLKLTVPIFSSLERSAKTQQAKITLEQSKLDRDKKQQELIQNMENAQSDYQVAIQNYDAAKQLVDLSQSIYDKEQIKFTEGMTTSMNLTTAEEQLYQAQNQYIQSIFNVVQSKSALYQAMGKY